MNTEEKNKTCQRLMTLSDKICKVLEEEKKRTHKIVEDKFWLDPTDENTKGEFELYGEYEPFFEFAKKIRNQALTNAQSIIRDMLKGK